MAAQGVPDVRDETGLGLVELVLAMFFISVAMIVLVSSFSSAAGGFRRASAKSTAGVIADSQMERYRAMTYDWIGLNTSATLDTTYKGDTACVGTNCTDVAPTAGASACQSGGTVYASFPLNCAPTQTVVGPDTHNYRMDTYVRSIQSTASRTTKLVTVVVRDSSTLKVLAREESDFDYCDALPDPSGTGQTC